MTYGDLLKELETLTPEQLDMDVTSGRKYCEKLISYLTAGRRMSLLARRPRSSAAG